MEGDSEETEKKMQEEVRLKDAIGMAEHEVAVASEVLREANINLYDLTQELEDLGL